MGSILDFCISGMSSVIIQSFLTNLTTVRGCPNIGFLLNWECFKVGQKYMVYIQII